MHNTLKTRRMPPAAALPLVLVLTACALGHPTAEPTRIGPADVVATGDWSSGGELIVAAGTRERGGKLAICGVWAQRRQSVLSRPLNKDIVASGIAYLDSARVLTGFDDFRQSRAAATGTLEGASAACVLTSRAWEPRFAEASLAIRLPRRQIELDSDDGLLVRFRQLTGQPEL